MELTVTLITLFIAAVTSQCPAKRRVYINQPGDTIVTGLFDVHVGHDCRDTNLEGVRLLHAAHWAVDELNKVNYVPNVTLGFKAVDVCGDKEMALQRTFGALYEAGYSLERRCRAEHTLGYVGPANEKSTSNLEDLLKAVGVPYVQSVDGVQRPVIKATTEFLQKLNCSRVTAITFEGQMLDLFRRAARSANICVSHSILLHDKATMPDLTSAVSKLSANGVNTFVLFGNDQQIHTLMRIVSKTRAVPHNGTWIIHGITSLNRSLITKETEGQRCYFIQPEVSAAKLEIDVAFERMVATYGGPLYTSLYLQTIACKNSSKRCENLLDVDKFGLMKNAVLPVFALADSLRSKMRKCPGCRRTPSLTQQDVDSKMRTSAVGNRLLKKVLGSEFSIFRLQEDDVIKVGSYVQQNLALMDDGSDSNIRQSCTCSGQCDDPVPVIDRWSFLFRHDTWVIVCLTIGGCGLFTDLIILIYIVVYVLRGRRTEGSQFFTVLLIVGNMSVYCSVVPYALEPSTIVCTLKMFGSSLGLSVVFAVMLARLIMMRSTDTRGLQGHISGLLQAVILFFMLLNQFTVATLLWWFGSSGLYDRPSCTEDVAMYMVSNSYDTLLLVLLLVLGPLTARNRRNYREALQFVVSNSVTLCAWVTLMTFLLTFKQSWHDPVKSITTVAIATGQLIVIFIPRACAIATSPETKSFGIPTVSANHLSAGSDVNVNGSSIRVYETLNRGFVPDENDSTPEVRHNNGYVLPAVNTNPNASRTTLVYRKATII
ncbi:Uncharacterised protein g6764 [Pycnogonum litorale]